MCTDKQAAFGTEPLCQVLQLLLGKNVSGAGCAVHTRGNTSVSDRSTESQTVSSCFEEEDEDMNGRMFFTGLKEGFKDCSFFFFYFCVSDYQQRKLILSLQKCYLYRKILSLFWPILQLSAVLLSMNLTKQTTNKQKNSNNNVFSVHLHVIRKNWIVVSVGLKFDVSFAYKWTLSAIIEEFRNTCSRVRL